MLAVGCHETQHTEKCMLHGQIKKTRCSACFFCILWVPSDTPISEQGVSYEASIGVLMPANSDQLESAIHATHFVLRLPTASSSYSAVKQMKGNDLKQRSVTAVWKDQPLGKG